MRMGLTVRVGVRVPMRVEGRGESHLVSIGHECEEVVGGLDGREAAARDEDGLRALEALDRRTHCRLELQHLDQG